MKKLAAVILLALSAHAMADQCQIMDSEAAQRAKLLVKNNSEILELCQPCGQKVKDATSKVVRSTKLEGNELIINGKGADMAYTYIKVAPRMYVNVAKVVGCPAEGVSDSVSK